MCMYVCMYVYVCMCMYVSESGEQVARPQHRTYSVSIGTSGANGNSHRGVESVGNRNSL